jgi:hypothetical protein
MVLGSPSSVSFNDSDAFIESATFGLENKGTRDVQYNIRHLPALTVYTIKDGETSPAKAPLPIAPDAYAAIEFSASSVTVPAGGKVAFRASATPQEGLSRQRLPVYSGYIELSGTDGFEPSLTIPSWRCRQHEV